MNADPDDRLIDAALTATEGGEVDWDGLRRTLPDDGATLEHIAAIATLMAAHGRADAPGVGAVPESTATVAFRWGPLDVRRRLGEGSFGEVFAAWDPRLEREVALKLRHAAGDAHSGRWLDEARRLARVRHPNVVTVYGAEVHEGRAGMWMELVHGRTLEDLVRRDGPLGANEGALVGLALCGALSAVHGAGLVHGDVKTGNVVREGRAGHARDAGRIVLMDFGSAHESTAEEAGAPGTPLFTAPEVLAGGAATARSDVWSLGVVLYRLVTGAWPYEATSLAELRDAHARAAPASARTFRPELPEAFVAAIDRALERDPERRWNDALSFERALRTTLGIESKAALDAAGRAIRRRDRARFAMVAVGALLAAAGWTAWAYGPSAWMAWRMRQPALVAEEVAVRAGETANAFLGGAVRAIGDVNGDGHDEVLVSSGGVDGSGIAYLFTPALHGLEPILAFRGHQKDGGIGPGGAADVNGDGHSDLILASAFSDVGEGRDAGRVQIFLGGASLDTTADFELHGTHPAQYMGYGYGLGDVSGDGHADVLVGAPYDRTGGPMAGRVFLLLGGPDFDAVPDREFGSGSQQSNFGHGVEFLGDYNADGFGDFVVSAPTEARRGVAYVYFGGPALDDRPDLVMRGEVDDGWYGVVRSPAGDVNGDGHPDLLATIQHGDGLEKRSGAVDVFFGGPDVDAVADLRLAGERRGDGFGAWADGVRDVDGDGFADILVGAPWYDMPGAPRSGRIYLYLGGPRLDDVPDLALSGPMGSTLCYPVVVPDLRGDGIGGLMVGAKEESRDEAQSGAVHLFDLARWSIHRPTARDGWTAGGRARLRWSGATRVDVSISHDGGRSWRTIARRAGGRNENALSVTVPAEAIGAVRVRLVSAAGWPGRAEREFPLATR